MGKTARNNAIASWAKESRLTDELRAVKGWWTVIPKEKVPEYSKIMEEVLREYEEKVPPAMPCVAMYEDGDGLLAEYSSSKSEPREHQERQAFLGDTSEEFMAMIHTAIPDGQVYKIPGAKAAVDKEWDKLFGIDAFATDEAEE